MLDPLKSIKIAVVGDVHELWQPIEDRLALQALGVDLVLFVGDIGNEAVEVVRAIANLDIPKAVILGNHDAWYSAFEPQKKPSKRKCPYDRTKEDWVQQQLDLLGSAHVGFSCLDFPALNLSVVGSRPFSWGGSKWKKANFYRDRFNVNNFEESTERITHAVAQAAHETIIFLGHNGPLGLGAEASSICGKDWKPVGGDYGDPDFMNAIEQSYQMRKHVPLVTFGHMHHHLKLNNHKSRTAIATNSRGTIFLNAACTPRIYKDERGRQYRNFSIVTLASGQVQHISLLWLNSDCQIVSENVMWQSQSILAVA
ncbi:TIGR04168 family protein [Pseudanabaena mucicola]|uniref:TIGR04168 family protein n=1 Tax=Pseudanabaena mucicola FACHB-723 TaxID=2692860 RepID=A0ABR7ZUL9_9CYAN|nr:TIGR04168 family protein [Pseudanabaena mucicola]MBD2187514.1 TIGR04168 family protein [Pseudanabaena mucicola FACHB-723]